MAAVTTHPFGNPSLGSSMDRNDKFNRSSSQLNKMMEKRTRDTVDLQEKDIDAIVIIGKATEAGKIIEHTVGGDDSKPKQVIYNRETDQSRGFGFVTMSTVEETEKAWLGMSTEPFTPLET